MEFRQFWFGLVTIKCCFLVQEFFPKILEVITDNWDNDLHIAGLRLLNGLQVPDHTHALLKKLMPSLMEILQMGSTLGQVQDFCSP